MKSFLFLSLFLFFAASIFAQSYTRTWNDCDTPKAVFEGSDKLASAIDGAENLYTAGYIGKASTSLPAAVYVRKYSKAGTLLWEVTEPVKVKSQYPANKTFALAVTKNGESVLSYNSYTAPDMNVVICKFDAAGKKLWQSGFNGPGNNDDEQPQKIIIDTSGKIYLLVAESYNNSYNTSYVVKYGGKGLFLWSHELKGAKLNDGTYSNYTASDATVDSAGNIYVTGSRQKAGSNLYDICTYKLFTYGDSAWSQVFSRNNQTDSRGYTIRYAKQDNTVVMCGTTRKSKDSILVVKYKALGGKEVWNSRFLTRDYSFIGHSLIDADNNIFVTSAFNVSPAVETYVSKVSSSGALVWSKIAFPFVRGSQYDDPYRSLDAQTDSASNYYVTFNKNGKLLLQKYDKLGNVLFEDANGMENTGTVRVLYGGIGVTSNQDIYISGLFNRSNDAAITCRYKYTLQKGSLLAGQTLTAKQSMAYSSQPGGLLYPNPARGEVNLPLSAIAAGSSIRVFDVTGRQVVQKQLSAGQTKIDVSSLKPGVYTLQLVSGTQQSTYKFIKE